MAEEWLFPLAPMPLRIENYPDLETNWSKKIYQCFIVEEILIKADKID